MGTVRYVLRVDNLLKDGTAPVDLIYSLSGIRKSFRTSIKLYPDSWDAEKQLAVYINKAAHKQICPQIKFDLLPTSKEVEEFNSTILELNSTIKE
jgi:hypothetical protein